MTNKLSNLTALLGKQVSFGLIGLVTGLLVTTGLQIALAWTGPSATPPNNNTSAPLNVSATAQTKAGGITLPSITDYDNTGYYVDPHSTSRLNYGVFDNAYS